MFINICASISHLTHLGRCGLSQQGWSSGGWNRWKLGRMLGGCSGYWDVLD